jgi:hypothetical protein
MSLVENVLMVEGAGVNLVTGFAPKWSGDIQGSIPFSTKEQVEEDTKKFVAGAGLGVASMVAWPVGLAIAGASGLMTGIGLGKSAYESQQQKSLEPMKEFGSSLVEGLTSPESIGFMAGAGLTAGLQTIAKPSGAQIPKVYGEQIEWSSKGFGKKTSKLITQEVKEPIVLKSGKTAYDYGETGIIKTGKGSVGQYIKGKGYGTRIRVMDVGKSYSDVWPKSNIKAVEQRLFEFTSKPKIYKPEDYFLPSTKGKPTMSIKSIFPSTKSGTVKVMPKVMEEFGSVLKPSKTSGITPFISLASPKIQRSGGYHSQVVTIEPKKMIKRLGQTPVLIPMQTEKQTVKQLSKQSSVLIPKQLIRQLNKQSPKVPEMPLTKQITKQLEKQVRKQDYVLESIPSLKPRISKLSISNQPLFKPPSYSGFKMGGFIPSYSRPKKSARRRMPTEYRWRIAPIGNLSLANLSSLGNVYGRPRRKAKRKKRR